MSDSAAAARYRRARRAQNELNITEAAAGIREETDAFHTVNRETGEAAAGLRWWTVAWIDWAETRRGHYWDRLGAALDAAAWRAAR